MAKNPKPKKPKVEKPDEEASTLGPGDPTPKPPGGGNK